MPKKTSNDGSKQQKETQPKKSQTSHSQKMLIDASHQEEIRVAVMSKDKLEDFDIESLVRKQLKGNIFLAKVTRVEPSLQAAFVNYGGNRHGFLPFSEIHPDYFRIPVEDKQKLIEEEERIRAELAEEQHAIDDQDDDDQPDDIEHEDASEDESDDDVVDASDDDEAKAEDESDSDNGEEKSEADGNQNKGRGRRRGRYRGRGRNRSQGARRKESEIVDDAETTTVDRNYLWKRMRRSYKIQEVIKRGQIMLVQITKEERGNKGAAATTYITLPGRYSVLMPNSAQGGGVSRKIADRQDRKRMKSLLDELSLSAGMSVILRTAGVTRTKTEIKRDLDYLLRLWDSIRELTLKSTAPAMIYEEANLIKRAIRDIYHKDVDEVVISGDEGYKQAREMMKLLIPSHVRKVKQYKDDVPLFTKRGIERQIEAINSNTVQLRSGGYLVINPTEALVSIDVNSGRATRERHIEETALNTNLEAAEEVARQLRLRDLGGLVVIDFIDMETYRNNRQVEKKLRDALSNDRARVQVGKISTFGLLELSRQRLRPSLNETNFQTCPHCNGNGFVKTVDSAALSVLRAVEDAAIAKKESDITVDLPTKVGLYLFNEKRGEIASLEQRYGIRISFSFDDEMGPSDHVIESLKPQQSAPKDKDEDESENSEQDNAPQNNSDNQERKGKRSRNNRNRRRGRNQDRRDENSQNNSEDNTEAKTDAPEKTDTSEPVSEEKAPAEKAAVEDKPAKPKSPRKKPAAKSAPKEEKTEKTEMPKDAGEAKDKAAAEDKPAKKPSRAKAPARKKAEKADKEDGIVIEKASNDSAKAEPEPKKPSEHEVINKAPDSKKRGWWKKIVE